MEDVFLHRSKNVGYDIRPISIDALESAAEYFGLCNEIALDSRSLKSQIRQDIALRITPHCRLPSLLLSVGAHWHSGFQQKVEALEDRTSSQVEAVCDHATVKADNLG